MVVDEHSPGSEREQAGQHEHAEPVELGTAWLAGRLGRGESHQGHAPAQNRSGHGPIV